MKIYSGIKDANGNIPWIDDETGEVGADKDGSRTLNLKYKRAVKKFQGLSNHDMRELAELLS